MSGPPASPSQPSFPVVAPIVRTASDPEMEAIVEHLAVSVGKIDPEASVEIPPPPRIDAENRDPYLGTTFDGRYKIERLLGEGGMGFVYLARHKVIDKKVAVKVLRADMARDREILDRFVQEARSASSIGNPHIIDISDFGDLPDGSTYFVMEYLDGKPLSDLIEVRTKGSTISTERICNIGVQMCDGLSAAHTAEIVHRDLKPDNIFLITRGTDRDFVKILDFGIAKVSKAGNTKLTRAGAVFGTPHYMSPEQAAGAPIDSRTDIYSIGVILYELTAGQLPFNADNFMGILTQHMYKAPVPIRALVPAPECPPGLEAIILKCLSKKPDARYSTMDDLAADLERVKRGEVPTAVGEMMARSGGFNVPHDFFKPPPKPIVPATPAAPRNPWPRVVWIAGVVAAVGIATFVLVKSGESGAGTQPSAEPVVPQTAAPTAPPAPEPATVALMWTPSTAVGTLEDGTQLKTPATISIPDGKTITVEIKQDGFESAKVVLDGKERAKQLELKPLAPKPGAGGRPLSAKPGAPGKPAPGKPGQPGKPGGRGEVIDVW